MSLRDIPQLRPFFLLFLLSLLSLKTNIVVVKKQTGILDSHAESTKLLNCFSNISISWFFFGKDKIFV